MTPAVNRGYSRQLSIAGCLMLTVIVFLATWRWRLANDVDSQLAAIHVAGLPTNGEEIISLLKEHATWKGSQQERVQQVDWAVRTLRSAGDDLDQIADVRARELEESHARLRHYVGGGQVKVKPYHPDVLAVYVLVPGGGR